MLHVSVTAVSSRALHSSAFYKDEERMVAQRRPGDTSGSAPTVDGSMTIQLSTMPTLWCTALRACLSAFEALGLDARRIAETAGISETVLADPDVRVPLETTARIWPAAQSQWRRPGLGLHAGAALPAGALGVLEFVFAASETVRDGLKAVVSSFPIVSGGLTRFDYVEDEAGRLIFGGVAPEQVRDYALTAVVGLLHRFDTRAVGVELAGPPFDSQRSYRKILRCDVTFHGARNQIVVDRRVLDLPLPSHYRGLQFALEREIDRLKRSVGSDVVDDVKRTIALLLPGGAPELDEVARRLSMGQRTLQRRLGERGTSLREATEEVRHQLALRHLESARLNVAEIAHVLGYSDPSAFTRAFKRWTGISPSEARGSIRSEE